MWLHYWNLHAFLTLTLGKLSGWLRAWKRRIAHSAFWVGGCVGLRGGQDSVMAKRQILKASVKQTRVLQSVVEYFLLYALALDGGGGRWSNGCYPSFLSSISSGAVPYKSETSPFKSYNTERYCTGTAEKVSAISILWSLKLSFVACGGCSFVVF
jgi:hypothetical protein